MPTSDPNSITPIMNTVLRLNPKSILDLGVGFGKYGVLCREYLDIQQGRLLQESWITSISGVEGFKGYENPLWDVYDYMTYCDFSDNYAAYRGFDLVLMIDSLEHVGKDAGMDLLVSLMQHNKNVLVSCPTGQFYLEQGAVNDNEYDRHRAHWTPKDFTMLGGQHIYTGVCTVFLLRGK